MKIRNLMLLAVGLIIYPFTQINAQEFKGDDILGVWLNEDKDAHVEIYKSGEVYFGKIIWLKEPIREETGEAKLDDKNEDESLRNRPVMGLNLLNNFTFDGDDEWEDGTIYDPKNGKTYSCYMTFEDESKQTLKVRGYIGFSLIGRTTYWTKVE